MTTTIKLTEVANPAAMAWEWQSVTDDGTYTHAVTWIRGTWSLHYGTKSPQSETWTNTLIVNPERFGFDGTLNGARIAAKQFVGE